MGNFSFFETLAVFSVLAIALIGLVYALFLRRQVLREPTGNAKMNQIWRAIQRGAEAYLSKQWRAIRFLIAGLVFVLFLSAWLVPPSAEAVEQFGTAARMMVALGRAGAFLMGAIFSLMVGRLGMQTATKGNIRVAAAADENDFPRALKISYRSGMITGMLTVGLGLLGGTIIFIIFGKAAPDPLLGFGFGGSLIAFFMRVGGGIYTKAADVGADLVGKVEKNIPEDDPRNPAVIADLVGDNVGDCAGMAADVFESYEVTFVSALILGVILWHLTGDLKWIVFPLLARSVGVIGSMVGTYFVKLKEGSENAMEAINRGFYAAAIFSVITLGFLAYYYMKGWQTFASTVAGVILVIAIDKLTERFTDYHYQPVLSVAKSTRTGAATTILQGLSLGMESSVWSLLVIALTVMAAIGIYWGQPVIYILYGVSLTGIGMMTLTGNNVAMDSYGPIADNAGGIGEMAGLKKRTQEILAKLDATGNTTKAVTKGVAISSAVIAAFSLFGSYIADVQKVNPDALKSGIRISEPVVLVGLLIGGAVIFLISGFLIQSVNRAAAAIILEVRRQFKDGKILKGKRKPDYQEPVSLCTRAAQKELFPLGILAVVTPLLTGLLLGVEALGAFLAGVILSGQLMAVFMSNAGGAWDNAKKYVEMGHFGGKGSEPHKASVVGDTVGDPLKDTSGPALNPMIKLMNLVAVITAPILVNLEFSVVVVLVVIFLFVLVLWSIRQSKKQAFEIV